MKARYNRTVSRGTGVSLVRGLHTWVRTPSTSEIEARELQQKGHSGSPNKENILRQHTSSATERLPPGHRRGAGWGGGVL